MRQSKPGQSKQQTTALRADEKWSRREPSKTIVTVQKHRSDVPWTLSPVVRAITSDGCFRTAMKATRTPRLEAPSRLQRAQGRVEGLAARKRLPGRCRCERSVDLHFIVAVSQNDSRGSSKGFIHASVTPVHKGPFGLELLVHQLCDPCSNVAIP